MYAPRIPLTLDHVHNDGDDVDADGLYNINKYGGEAKH